MNTAGMIAALCTTTLLLAACNGEDLSPLFTGHEFSQLVFDDVTQQDLIDAALMSNVSLKDDPDTGLTGIFAQLSTEVSEVCLQDTSTFLQDLQKYKNYALQMRASFAQVPSKVDVAFTHRLKFVGNFELCDAVKSGSIEGEPSFDAVPCMMNLHVTDPLPLQYEVGVCIPNSCNEGELSTMVMTDIKQFNKSEYVSFQCSYKEPGSWSEWFMVFIIVVFSGLVIWGTVYDYLQHRNTNVDNSSGTSTYVAMKQIRQVKPGNEDEPVAETAKVNPDVNNEAGSTEGTATASPKPADDPLPNQKPGAVQERPQMSKGARILLGFSVTTNASEVMSCRRPPSNLGAINGIRVLSMTWIIWLHTTFFIHAYKFLDNPAYLTEDIRYKFWYDLIDMGDLGVDSFFVLSGLLVTYLTLKKMKVTGGEINWPFFYLQRYVRLTPLLAFAIGAYVGLSALLGRGYQKNQIYAHHGDECTRFGWTNIVYLNNLFPGPYYVSVCMGWSWYLANDMQFYIISPLFLLLLCRPSRAKLGIALTIVVTILSVIITMQFSWRFRQVDGNYPGGPPDEFALVSGVIYATPWCRIQSYTVGIFVGYLLYKVNGQKKKIPLVWNAVGWSAAMVAVFIPVFAMHFTSRDHPVPLWFGGIWMGTKRVMFASGVGWITYACITGNGGFVDAFLSAKIWLPLSRISYAAYLFHPIIMTHWIFTSKTEFHWNAYNVVYMFLSFFVVTYIVSFISSLLIEIPLVKMTKILTERPVIKVQRRGVL